MANPYRRYASLLLAAAVTIYACADLDVLNLNEPDRERVLSSFDDAVALISGAYNQWYHGVFDYGGPGLFLSQASFQHTSPWAPVDQSIGKVFGDPALIGAQVSIESIQNKTLAAEVQTLRILSNGFIVTSLLWASAMAAIIDRRLAIAATFFAVTAAATLFGVIHSPFSDGRMFLPWQIDTGHRDFVLRYTIGYLLVAGMLIAWGWWRSVQGEDTADYLEIENDA